MLKETFKQLSLLSVFILVPDFVSAGVVINEIMYNPAGVDSGHEWVEIYNDGLSNVNVVAGGTNVAWRFSDGSQHALTLITGSAGLAPGQYAVIADNSSTFLREYPGFSGTLFDSSFALNNTEETISLLATKDGEILSEVSYSSDQGANGDESSLQFQGGDLWVGASPTPGGKNSFVGVTSLGSADLRSSMSAHYAATPITNVQTSSALQIGTGRDRVVAIGSPVQFRAESNVNYLPRSKFTWNFGDGSEGIGELIDHTYEYPGEYVVVLNAVFSEGIAVARTTIKVIDPVIRISFADKKRIEVRNTSSYEVNLLGRGFLVEEKFFAFPKDTIISAGQSLSFSSKVTGLYPSHIEDVNLLVVGNAESSKLSLKIEEQRFELIDSIKNKINDLLEQVNGLVKK